MSDETSPASPETKRGYGSLAHGLVILILLAALLIWVAFGVVLIPGLLSSAAA